MSTDAAAMVAWLGEQLNEDERIARAVQHEDYWLDVDGWSELATEVREHAQRHDPARVLREIEAKRRIVERYAWLREHGDTGGAAWILPLLALPYSDRPGYRQEWRQ